ncbi:MAG TPA: transglutaminase domain-containing protein [Dissulfurispiraceae bacterium]|nr:transglutaminase domain-containing protein [Dissulfurispiraceae bacterium]
MKKKQAGEGKEKKASLENRAAAEKVTYRDWQVHPHVIDTGKFRTLQSPVWRRMTTKHEGDVLYYKLWNFWVRAGFDANAQSTGFFRDYESANSDTDALLKDIGFTWRKAENEEDIWGRIGMVWTWIKNKVIYDPASYITISSIPGEWPSILDYARYYKVHGKLVWAACFSKAHLFATLLGRVIYPRYRFAIAEAHHSENGAPPTATHVYVAVYVGERWFYLDPTAIYIAFPDYAHRQSIGVSSFTTVDYEHPHEIIPVPLSGFDGVPHLPS